MTKKKPVTKKVSDAAVEELTADLKRIQADFINYKRRAIEEQGQVMQVAKVEVVKQLLPLLDNLERAASHLPKELKGNQWAEGVARIVLQAEETLKAIGVTKIAATGQAFDPHFHEAVSLEEGEGEHEVVSEELQAGYHMDGFVIRPSMVRVKQEKSDSIKKKEK